MKKNTKRSLLLSVLALILCCALLAGTTLAWFTDTASSGVNKIQAGNLDVQLLDADTGASIEGQTLQFKKADNSTEVLWEPGCTYELPAFVVKNNGNLTLKYMISISGIKGDAKLNDAIVWSMQEEGKVDAIDINGGAEVPLAPGAKSGAITISGHMKEEAGNEYQGLSIDGIGITVRATQLESEFDSFNNTYDKNATYPPLATYINNTTGNSVTLDGAGQTSGSDPLVITDNHATSTIPAGTLVYDANGENPVATDDTGSLNRDIKTTEATADSVTYDISYKYVEANGTTTNVVKFGKVVENVITVSTGLRDVKVTHTHGTTTTPMTPAHDTATKADGTYHYDSANGKIYIWSSEYSSFAITFQSDFAAATGGQGYATLQEAVSNAKDGETVTLIKDVAGAVDGENKVAFTMNKAITLDGNGHTITVTGDSSVDTFAIQGMAGGTIKNLTVDTAGVERAIRLNGEHTEYTIEKTNITCTGVGIHVKNSGKVTLDTVDVSCNASGSFTAHKRTGVMVGAAADVTLRNSEVVVIAADKVTSNTDTWGKGLYVGNGAKGQLTVDNTNVTADFALAIDGSKDVNKLNNITVNSGSFNGVFGSPSGYSYKEIVIKGGTFNGFGFAANTFYDTKNPIARLSIMGGEFSAEPDAKYYPEGYGAIQNGNMFEVISGNFAKNEAELKAKLSNGGTVYLANDITLTDEMTISNDFELIGNGNAVLSAKPVTVTAEKAVFRNVGFADPTNTNNNASSVYVYAPNKTVVFDGCTFEDNQWDAIQYTSKDATSITITNCSFALADSRTNCHRFIHIEPRNNGQYTAVDAIVVITNNKFDADNDTCNDSLITMYGPKFVNMTISGNTVTGSITLTDSYESGNIWIADGLSSTMWSASNGFTVVNG